MIELRYTDFYGNLREAPAQTVERIERAIGADAPQRAQPVRVVPADTALPRSVLAEDGRTVEPGTPLEIGYYRVDEGDEPSTVIVTPSHAFVPRALEQHKEWGIAAQLYTLRSDRNWGIGDFGDLRQLVRIGASAGAATIALNPLHELHLTNPGSASPYSPTSRLHLNALYIDVAAAAAQLRLRLDVDRALATDLESLREQPLVDYVRVARHKLKALRTLHKQFKRAAEPLHDRFQAFRAAGGDRLRALACYEALMEHFTERKGGVWGWMQWPQKYHDPHSDAVREFAKEHAHDVAFYEWLQWIADMQLQAAADEASSMAIGLYRDLAVGVDINSADVWMDAQAYCLDLCVGAPPDPLNTQGQNWSLPPLNPRVLRERAYAPYVELLRANMRHAGALRIDHVMGLMRLFCIPRGRPASEGTYLNYPLAEMLGVLALESVRNRCMIVGEDLGTVAPGFREQMQRYRIFGCRLLYFERGPDGAFREPQQYTADAVASTGTHDLAPMAGFLESADGQTREQLVQILRRYGDLPEDKERDLFTLILSAYRALGRSAARLLLAQLEDVFLQREPVNTPGTFDEVPNWRRKLTAGVEAFEGDSRFIAITAALRQTRGTRSRV